MTFNHEKATFEIKMLQACLYLLFIKTAWKRNDFTRQ